MGQVAVFIDGGYLDKLVYFDHANKRLNYEKLVNELAKPDELLRAYYREWTRWSGSTWHSWLRKER
jgi:hypothetical protein